jgi:hypothetical protein
LCQPQTFRLSTAYYYGAKFLSDAANPLIKALKSCQKSLNRLIDEEKRASIGGYVELASKKEKPGYS